MLIETKTEIVEKCSIYIASIQGTSIQSYSHINIDEAVGKLVQSQPFRDLAAIAGTEIIVKEESKRCP